MNSNERLGVFRQIGIKYPEPKTKKHFSFSVPFGAYEAITGVGIFLVGILLLLVAG